MQTVLSRQLGRSGIQVSALGLGCWAIGGPFWNTDSSPSGWGQVDDKESIRAVHRGLDLGVNFFDTADVYGAGHSERVLGQAIAGRRAEVVIATKFGYGFDEKTKIADGLIAAPAHIRKACEESLGRLNTDYIDLYQFHINDHAADQGGEVRDTLEQLVKEGKIRCYGWSTDFPERARVFAEGPNCAAIQFESNVLLEAAPLVALCEELNLAAIDRGPLAMGVLTGKFTADFQLPADDVRGKRIIDENGFFSDGRANPKLLKQIEAIREILTSNGRTLAQGALAWLWARSEKHIPIPGFKTVAQVEDNCGALEKGPLTADQMREIAKLLGR